MNEPILCLVILCLLVWVYLLKKELEDLKEVKRRAGIKENAFSADAPSGKDFVKGARSFKIGSGRKPSNPT